MRKIFSLFVVLLYLQSHAQSTDTGDQPIGSLIISNTTENFATGETTNANQVPISNAGVNQSITLPASSVTLDGSASYDPDGRIIQYYWFQAKGPVSGTIGNAFAAKPVITGLATAGQYVFVLQVKDNNGDLGYGQITVTVIAGGTVSPPPCVSNRSPENGSYVFSLSQATLLWPTVQQASSYDVYLWSGTTAAATPVATVTANGYIANGLSPNVQYYWYVVPRNAGGAAQGCSANTTRFTTIPGATCTSNISPANGAIISTSSKATLSWNSVSGATSYDLHIVAVSGNQYERTINVNTLSYDIAFLDGSTTYNWYVLPMFGNTSTPGCSSTATTFTTAPRGPYPDCFINIVSPSNLSILPSQTSARLTWLATANAAFYEIYLAAGNNEPKTLVAKTTALTYYVSNLTAGTPYSWYILPRNAEGVQVSCDTINVNRFTTATATGGANKPPVANAGVNQSISLPGSSVSLDGRASYDPDDSISEYYWYQVSGPVTATIGNAFSAFPVVTGLTTAGKYVFGLQVKDKNKVPAYASVTVTVLPAGSITIPACIINTSPINGSTLTTQTTAALSWPATAQASSYDVFLWTGAASPATPTANVTGTSYSASNLLPSTSYSWYIVPKNASGSASGCASTATTFTTAIPPPPCSELLSPLNGDTILTPTSAVLTWSASPTATSYDLYLTTNYTQLGIPYATGITSTSYTATGLYPVSAYMWHVVPRNAGGYGVNCSKLGFFDTGLPPVPTCVANLSPANGAILGDTTVTLTWNQNPFDVYYDIYIWSGPIKPSTFTARAFGSSSYTLTGLAPSTRYNWYVVPWNKSGYAQSDCSINASSFTTGIAAPQCVANISPANSSILPSQTSAMLKWPPSAGALSYDVYLAAGNGVPTVLVTNTTAVSYYAINLTPGTLYSWYVAPRNANGANAACGVINKTSFTTANATNGGNLSPISNAGNNQNTTLPASPVTLDGTASYDPDGRVVQYYWYQAKGPISSSISNAFAATPTITGLNAAGTYVYVLQVKDNIGATGYSQVAITVNTSGTLRQVSDEKTVLSVLPGVTEAKPSGVAIQSLRASVSPNPAAPGKTIRLQVNSDKAGTAIVRVVNVNGITMATKQIALVPGTNTTSINLAQLTQGFYFISVTNNANMVSVKLLIE